MERVAVIMGKMHSGGKKNLVMEYYRHIDRNKIQFDFICDSDSNAIPKEEIESLGGRVYIVSPYQKIFRNIKEVKKILRDNEYKIVHGYNGTMNVFTMFAAKTCGVPIRINESISMGHIADKKTYIKNILKPFSKLFSTHFMSNGETCGRWQFGDKAFEDGKVTVFKTVVDTEKHGYDIELRKKCREELGLKDNIVFGHIGRLTEQKNTLFIIDIFKEIYDKEKKARLVIIGDGNLREEMIQKINKEGLCEVILYLGRREDIHQFYNAFDAFLLPSLYEGLPVVGVEAQCSGLPMFFSTEIAKESSPCDDIGFFIDLAVGPRKWAEIVLQNTKANIDTRRDHRKEVCDAGFDSLLEGQKMSMWYLDEIYEEERVSCCECID